jgi:hypothetical protein
MCVHVSMCVCVCVYSCMCVRVCVFVYARAREVGKWKDEIKGSMSLRKSEDEKGGKVSADTRDLEHLSSTCVPRNPSPVAHSAHHSAYSTSQTPKRLKHTQLR